MHFFEQKVGKLSIGEMNAMRRTPAQFNKASFLPLDQTVGAVVHACPNKAVGIEILMDADYPYETTDFVDKKGKHFKLIVIAIRVAENENDREGIMVLQKGVTKIATKHWEKFRANPQMIYSAKPQFCEMEKDFSITNGEFVKFRPDTNGQQSGLMNQIREALIDAVNKNVDPTKPAKKAQENLK